MAEKVSSSRDRSRSNDSSDFHDEILDPRVQTELEKLNRASQTINSLEIKLNEARTGFRHLLNDSTARLDELHKKLGSSVDKARPYYQARIKAKEAQIETQNAAQRFERACSQLTAAKEMVYLAEQGFFCKGQPFDPAWQEMLNHATIKVNDAEEERLSSEVDHKQTALVFNEAEQEVKNLHKELRRSISKSRPYFELKARINQQMEDQKQTVSQLETSVNSAKQSYAEALRNLEQISDSIHAKRREESLRKEMGTRSSGVGAESPAPPPTYEQHAPSVTVCTGQSESVVLDTGQTESIVMDKGQSDVDTGPCVSKSPSSNSISSHNAVTKDGKSRTDNETSQNIQDRQSEHSEKSEVGEERISLPSLSITRNSPVGDDDTADSAFMSASLESNAEIMASLQLAKGQSQSQPFLCPRKASQEDFNDDAVSNDSASIASGTVLDDEQIESLMLEGKSGDYEKFLTTMDPEESDKWKRMSLPAKLSFLEDYVIPSNATSNCATSPKTAPITYFNDSLGLTIKSVPVEETVYRSEMSSQTNTGNFTSDVAAENVEIMIVNSPNEPKNDLPCSVTSSHSLEDYGESLEVVGKVTYV